MAGSKTHMTPKAAARIHASQSRSGKDPAFAARAKAAATRNARVAESNNSQARQAGQARGNDTHSQRSSH
ncbi:hypothetical protein TruAng_007312 [Truncatella angustata]|nr:hypothetical protein TruAng_007312 [Truncatella angustata]